MIAEQYANGASIADLADQWRMGNSAIRAALERAEAKVRRGRPPGPHRFTPQQDKLIGSQYDSGMTIARLAAEWHADRKTIRRAITRARGIADEGVPPAGEGRAGADDVAVCMKIHRPDSD